MIVLSLVGAGLSADPGRVRLATTTSTENSGLLAELIPPFEEQYDLRVDVIAVGTGKALRLGENGDVDMVLVHARAAEDMFIDQGYGVNRRDVMHNDFIIIGPSGDPAGLRGLKSAKSAFLKLAEQGVSFVSRGDDSGTHKKEKELWKLAQVQSKGNWYKEVGQGMGAVITICNDMQAYTLTDRGTYLAMQENIQLQILVAGDPVLSNPYGIIAINPAVHQHVNYMGAMQFIAWITSVEGQQIVRSFRKNGEILFYPDAVE